jgi:hypothetical protein
MEKALCESYRADVYAKRFKNSGGVAPDEFRATAANIDDQQLFARKKEPFLNRQERVSGLFAPRYDANP